MLSEDMPMYDKAYICEQGEIAYGITLSMTSPSVMSRLNVYPTAAFPLLILWMEAQSSSPGIPP